MWITSSVMVLIVTSFFSGRSQVQKINVVNKDTTTTTILLAKFVRQTRSPCCCYLHIKEKNMFRTIVSFRNRQLINQFIEVAYPNSCWSQPFVKDQLYNITVKKDPFSLEGLYININTTAVKEIPESLWKRQP